MPFWFGLALMGAHTQAGLLTIDQAVAIALQNGYAVLISKTRVDRQAAVVSEVSGQLGPRVNLGAVYTRFDKEGTSNFGGETVVTSPIDTKSFSANLSLPIDINGSLHRQVSAAKHSFNATKENFAA